MILQYLAVFALGCSSGTAANVFYQVGKYGQATNGTVIMLCLSSMVVSIVSLILSLS
jgi:hypothetical protein